MTCPSAAVQHERQRLLGGLIDEALLHGKVLLADEIEVPLLGKVPLQEELRDQVTTSFTLNNLEPIVMVLPKTGQAKVIGASDLLVSGKAR